ncbi:MAG TPA: methyltransferase domain-containing protein [Candidatus Dormibacteraeota bacterium]
MNDPADDVNPTIRGLLTRFLVGAGVELGPGHHPMPVLFSDVTIRYVDRWDPEQNRSLFPDVAAGSTFTTPDVIANLDVDRLSALSDESQDFVIASHLLEHLANPLAQLEDMHRVLRRGGVALIFLPDRRYTFDRKRSPTPLEHLIADHRDQVTVASDEHLEDHLRKTGVWQDSWTDEDRRREFAFNRERSIHVHCWTEDEFLPVLVHTVVAMGMQWELLDAMFVEDVTDGFEFGFALRRAVVDRDPLVVAQRLRTGWQLLAERAVRRGEAERQIAHLKAMPGFPIASGAVRLQRRLRRRLVKG